MGFENLDLQYICSDEFVSYDASLSYQTNWLYWTVEVYSFGKCYREWLNLPNWFPLPIYGDHGVAFSGELSKHEKESKPKHHITWFKDRAIAIDEVGLKKSIHIPHPWVLYRRRHRLKKSINSKGTIIFYSHSNEGIEIMEYDWDTYFNTLKKLPEDYHPFFICMHMHDIRKGYHLKLRKYGLPIISAGETSSQFFVDRFYDIVQNFNYATSPSGGSDIFICEEFGLKYFIFGEKVNYNNFSHDQLPLGLMIPRNPTAVKADKQKTELFSVFPPDDNFKKTKFISEVLGLSVDDNSSRKLVLQSLNSELFRHINEIILYLLKIIFRKIKKITFN